MKTATVILCCLAVAVSSLIINEKSDWQSKTTSQYITITSLFYLIEMLIFRK